MSKKVVASMLVAAMLTTSLAACGNSAAPAASEGIPASAAESKVAEGEGGEATGVSGKVVAWDTFTAGALNEANSQVIEAFKAKYPDVQMERIVKELGTMGETLKAAFMAGNAPDVLYYEGGIGTVGSYVKAGYLQKLNDAYEKFGWKDTLMSAAWEVPSVGDYIYGVGNEMETMGLYVNQDIMDKEGLQAPKTVEELTVLMQKLKDAGYTPLANLMGSKWHENMNLIGTVLYAFMSKEEIADCMNNDGSWDKESVRKAVATLQDWLDKGFFPDHPEVDGDAEQLFLNQDCVLTITGNWAVGNINQKAEFKASAYPFPGSESCADGGSQVNFAGGAYLVSAGSKNQDAALEYINFAVNTPEAATIWADVGGTVPPYTQSYETDLSELSETVNGYLSDAALKNTAGINMWLGVNSFDFFSTAGQKLIIGALDQNSFIQEADAATKVDVEGAMTKGSFKFD